MTNHDYGMLMWVNSYTDQDYHSQLDHRGRIVLRPLNEIRNVPGVAFFETRPGLIAWMTTSEARKNHRWVAFSEELARDVCGFENFVRI